MRFKSTIQQHNRPVAIWLLIGIGMMIIQVLLGGITRLTGSGLSITEWKPIMGAIPPLNEQQWLEAFHRYKQIPQYQYINTHFTLNDFKFIFFWEWFHRLWARLIGVVFFIPFIWFVYKKKINRTMVKPLLILFLLGGLQGLVGWIMVASGLQDLVYVSHIRLAIHFILALSLLCYTAWFVLRLLVPKNQYVYNTSLRKITITIMVILVIQLIYGAFMAGLKAATTAATWPTINGEWFPSNFTSYGNQHYRGFQIIINHPLVVQFIHRSIGYILAVIILFGYYQAKKIKNQSLLLNKIYMLPLGMVLLQIILGITTVLYSANSTALLYLGVAHQFVAMILLLVCVCILHLIRSSKRIM